MGSSVARWTSRDRGIAPRTTWIALTILCAIAAVAQPRAAAALRAVIAVGLVGTEGVTRDVAEFADAASTRLISRGFSPSEITLLLPRDGRSPSRDAIAQALQHVAGTAGPDDETWIILLGRCAPGAHDEINFQVSGPRLGATAFAASISKIPGRLYIVVLAADSGGFILPLTTFPRVQAVAATAATGEANDPRFLETWIAALTADPKADFHQLAVTASQAVVQYYKHSNLALPEHAQWIDPARRELVPILPPNSPTPANPAP